MRHDPAGASIVIMLRSLKPYGMANNGPIVLWWDRQVKGMLINAITQDWLCVDVVALYKNQVQHQALDQLKLLFDHDDVVKRMRSKAKPVSTDPAVLLRDIEEFIRILGLLQLGLGRGEYVTAVTGVFHLRRMLIELLIEETGTPNRGGVLHLNRLITDEQNELLVSLPPLQPTHDGVVAACLAYAEAYLPRARLMAKLHGVDWPEAFEAATWAHLKVSLGIDPPPGYRS